MYILIDKKTKRVKSISDGKIGYDKDKFNLKEITLKKEDKEKIDKGCLIYYDRKLLIKDTPEEKKNKEKKDLKEQIAKAKDINELKVIINKLI